MDVEDGLMRPTSGSETIEQTADVDITHSKHLSTKFIHTLRARKQISVAHSATKNITELTVYFSVLVHTPSAFRLNRKLCATDSDWS